MISSDGIVEIQGIRRGGIVLHAGEEALPLSRSIAAVPLTRLLMPGSRDPQK